MTIDQPTALAPETEIMTATETPLKRPTTPEGTDDMAEMAMGDYPEYWIG